MTEHQAYLDAAICRIANDCIGDDLPTVTLYGNEAKALTAELDRLGKDNANLRRRLAHVTAQHSFVQGGGFGRIDQEIREFGFRLVDLDSNVPRIEPLEGK